MECPNCGHELRTLILGQYPVKRTDVLRVKGGDAESGLEVEHIGPPRLEPMAYALQWIECSRCGHHMDDGIAEGLRFEEPETAEVMIEPGTERVDSDPRPG